MTVINTAARLLFSPQEDEEPVLEPSTGNYVHVDYGSADDATLHELGL